MNLLPCSACPWRTNKGATDIPLYSHVKAKALIGTVGTEDGFRMVMACHGSPDENPQTCRGYLAREGERNLFVRIEAAKGRSPRPVDVLRACQEYGIHLHKNYRAVLRKLTRTHRAALAELRIFLRKQAANPGENS